MKIDKGIAICTRPYVIRSLQSKVDNEIILNACDDLLEGFLKSVDDFMTKYDKSEKGKRETNALITFMADFEKRYIESQKAMEEKMNAITDSVNEKIAAQLMTLMTSFDKTISATLNDNMKKWIVDDMRNLESNIAAHIQTQLKTPMEQLLQNYNGSSGSLISVMKDVENKVNNMIQSSMEKWQESKELNVSQRQYLAEQINTIPAISRSVFSDLLLNLERKTNELDSMVNLNSNQISNLQLSVRDSFSTMAVIKDHTTQILTKTSKDMYSIAIKGSESQNTVYSLLRKQLTPMDGYEIEQTHGITNAMDITVKKINCGAIRIDVKNHNTNIRKSEVDKFKRDIEITGCSGILLSLETEIYERADYELEQLPNGKFAIYIGKNNYNIQIVIDSIRLIHRLEQLLSKSESGDCVTLTPEKVFKIQNHLKDFYNKLQLLRSHLNQSIMILDEIKLDTIDRIVNQKDEGSDKLQCYNCKKVFKSAQGHAMHIKKCGSLSEKTDDKVSDEEKVDEVIEPVMKEEDSDVIAPVAAKDDIIEEEKPKKKKGKKKDKEVVIEIKPNNKEDDVFEFATFG